MYHVTLSFGDDIFVEADDYEVDEGGDLVFYADQGDTDEAGDEVLTEVGRVRKHSWGAVFQVAEDEDEDEDEDDDEEVE